MKCSVLSFIFITKTNKTIRKIMNLKYAKYKPTKFIDTHYQIRYHLYCNRLYVVIVLQASTGFYIALQYSQYIHVLKT